MKLKHLKKLIIAVFLGLLFASPLTSQANAATINLPVFLKVNQYFVLYSHPKAPYVDSQNRLMVPLRMFCNRLFGADVGFDSQTKVVTVTFSGKTLKLTIGSKRAKIDGRMLELDTVPVLEEGYVFIPIRFLTDAFEIKTEWNSQYRYVSLADDRIMKTQEILYMEDTTQAQVSNPDAFIPISARLTVSHKDDTTYLDLVVDAKNVTGENLPEGKEDIEIHIVYNSGQTYLDPYRERPPVRDGEVVQKRMTPDFLSDYRLDLILFGGRTIVPW